MLHHLLRRSALVLSCLLIQALLASNAFAVTSPIGYASTSICSTSPPPLKSGTDPGFPGQWWNPNRYGTGWDIYFSNDQTQVVMFWLTYNASHQPIWLFNGGSTTMDASNEFWAPLYQVNQVIGSTNTTATQVGYISIAFVPGSATAAAIRWKWNAVSTTQSYDECIYNFFYGTAPATNGALTLNQSFTGSWYNPNQSGWGLDINVGTYSNGNSYEVDNALIYDTAGNPVWLEGSITNPALATTSDQLGYFTSKYSLTSNCSKSNCTSGKYIGSLTRRFTGSQGGNATLTATQTTGQVIAWPNATYSSGSVPIVKLSDTDVVSVDQTNCQVPAGSTCTVDVSWSSHLTTALVYKRDLTTNTLSSTPLNNLANGQYTDNLPIGADVQYEMYNGTPTRLHLMYTSAEVKVSLQVPTGPATPPSPQLASPPPDDTVSDSVGATNGKFSVDQSGNAQFEIPLYTPRGAGGLTPNLSLVYNSSYGDGLLGFGWQLHGMSSIALCRQAPEHGDGPVSTWMTDNPTSAVYCLDGERMDLVSGTNGAQGAVYRLESDSMTEIVVESAGSSDSQGSSYYSIPQVFAVYGKDGTVRHYGGTTANGGTAELHYQPGAQPGITMAWYENMLKDSNGNTVNFNYTGSTGEFASPVTSLVPASIVYNGGEVDFSTAPRPSADQNTSYQGGAAIVATPVWINTITVKSNNQVLRTYSPTYSASLINPALKSVTALTECGAGGICYKPTSFGWATVGNFLTSATSAWQIDSTDGASGGMFSHATPSSVKFGDIDGDGRSDVVWLHCDPGTMGNTPDNCNFRDFHEGFSTPGATGLNLLSVNVPNQGDSSNYDPNGSVPELSRFFDESKAWQLMDFNADGKADLLMLEPADGGDGYSGPTRIAVWGSAGRQYTNGNLSNPFIYANKFTNIVQNPQTGALGPMNFNGKVDTFVADFDGDGLPDLVTIGSQDGASVWLLKPTGIANQPYAFRGPYLMKSQGAYCGIGALTSQNLRVGDFDGDGRADLVTRQFVQPCTSAGFNVTSTDGTTSVVNGFQWVTSSTFEATKKAQMAAAKTGSSPTSSTPEYIQVMYSRSVDTTYGIFYFQPSGIQYWQVGDNSSLPAGSPLNVADDSMFQIADINGDGIADVMFADETTSNDQTGWVYELTTLGNQRMGSRCVVVNAAGNGCATSLGAKETVLGDYDGDGKADFWTVSSYGPTGGNVYSVYLWTGNGFATTPVNTGLFSGDIGTSPSWYGFITDLDGDGYPDSLEINPLDGSGSWKTVRVASRYQPRNLMTNVTSGLGAVTSLSYAPLTYTSVYYREYWGYNVKSGWGSPVQDVLSPRYVVQYADSSAPTSSNPNNLSTVRYQYSGFRMQGGGRGSLGFDKVYSIDAQTGIETVTVYNQSFPQTGTPRATYAYTNGQWLDSVCDPKGGGNPDSAACMAYGTQLDIQSNQMELSYATDVWNWHVLSQPADTLNTPLTSLSAPSPIFVYRQGGRAFKFGLDGALLSSQGYSFDYDTTYGNVQDSYTNEYTSTTTSTANLLRQTTTVETYLNVDTPPSSSNGYVATWHIGRLSDSTTTATPYVNGVADTANQKIRESSFDYDPSTGLLTGEHLQPNGSADQALDKYHFHDSYGNEIETVTCSAEAHCSSSSPLSAAGMTFESTDTFWAQRYTSSSYLTNCGYPAYLVSCGIYANTTSAPFWNGSSATEHVTMTVIRDAFGNPTQTTDMHGVVATHYYNALGREYFSASNTGAAAQTIYRWCAGFGTPSVPCPAGAAYRVDNVFSAGGTARAPETWVYYDVLTRPVLSVKQGFAATQYDAVKTTYDNLGRVYTKSEPYSTYAPTSPYIGYGNGVTIYNTTTTYDNLGRVYIVQRPNGSTVTTTFSGLTQTVTMSANGTGQTQTKTTVMDYLGRASTVTDSLRSTLQNLYDVSGNLTRVTRTGWEGRNSITQMGYDTLGRKTSMFDPDAGSWTYTYNALGEKVATISPIINSSSTPTCTATRYDGQGRVFSRSDYKNSACSGTADASATWTFDLAGNGLGMLAGASSNDGGTVENRNAYYDGFGRLSESDSTVGGVTYKQLNTYDQFGRPFQSLFQGTGIPQSGELYLYNAQGYAYQTQDAEYGLNGGIYQAVLAMDARGNVTQQEQANSPAMTTVRSYDPVMGWLTGISSGSPSGSSTNGAVQNLAYSYDNWGNLMSRSDTSPGSAINESFGYDSLQRLTSQSGSSSASWSYDSFGNPNPASNLYGSYSSTPAGPCNAANEVSLIGPDAGTGDPAGNDVRCYDSHGNVTRLLERGNVQLVKRQESYTAYDALRTVNFASSVSLHTTTWYYGLDRQRLERQDWTNSTGGGTPTTNVFIGNAEIDNAAGSPITVKRYIGGVIVSQTISGGAVTATNDEYLFTDNVGSTHRIVDPNGNLESPNGAQWFTPFGIRAVAATGAPVDGYTKQNFDTTLTHHGFTGHEEMDQTVLIHMNGRIYDANGGHFEQADPFVQDASNLQSYNRYAYLMNNPLASTDPTGYWGVRQQGYLRDVAAIAIAVWGGWEAYEALGGGWATAGLAAKESAVTWAATTGAASGFVSSDGSLNAAVLGAFDATANVAIGGIGNAYARVGAHALEGGVMSTLQGGRFGHGFVSAGLSAVINPAIGEHVHGVIAGGIAASISGGTISAVTGGKFANGAMTSAFEYSFNAALHHSNSDSANGNTLPAVRGPDIDDATDFDHINEQVIDKAKSAVFSYLGDHEVPDYEFLRNVPGGLSNPQFSISYVPATLSSGCPRACSPGVFGVDGAGGIVITALGAKTSWEAVFNITHEILHFNPVFVNMWKSGATSSDFDVMNNSVHDAMRPYDLPAATAVYRSNYDH